MRIREKNHKKLDGSELPPHLYNIHSQSQSMEAYKNREDPISNCLKQAPGEALLGEITQIGNLTGLKSDGCRFYGANFERAILLETIIAERKPREILEIGTGRGFGSFSMVRAAKRHGVQTTVTTLDLLGPKELQRWPIRWNGREEVAMLSRANVWESPELTEDRGEIREVTGPTTRTMPLLDRDKRRFDFVFIDAGHDLFSVVHDLAWSARLLSPSGCILMDDFAPLEEFGLGTCIAVSHARALFSRVEVIATQGAIFADGGDLSGRGMVFLEGLKVPNPSVSMVKLIAFRVLSKFLSVAHHPGLFPVHN